MAKFLMMRPLRTGPVVAALVVIAGPAFAQGTSAEREACTEDAVNLCSDTIPDVPKTTACMKAHLSQLSPRCRAIVADRPDETERARRPRRVEREVPSVRREVPPPDDAEDAGRRDAYGPPDGDAAEGRRYIDGGLPDGGTGERRYLYVDPDGRETYAPAPPDVARERARARIGHLCDNDEIDPETCALTERALR